MKKKRGQRLHPKMMRLGISRVSRLKTSLKEYLQRLLVHLMGSSLIMQLRRKKSAGKD
jgi:hypothetical protein